MDSAQLYRMLVFANVVEHGSLTAAADELGISRSMVSQHLKKLEQRCDTKLLQRTTRKMSLTEDGQQLYHHCAELLLLAKQAEETTQPKNKELRGRITISTPICFGEQFITPHIGEFHQEFPKIQINVQLDDRRINRLESNVDIAIQHESHPPADSTFIKLGQFDEYMVATPDYVKQHGSPLHPDMLLDHQWLLQTASYLPQSFLLKNSYGDTFTIKVPPFICCNSRHVIAQIAKQGVGIAILPSYLVDVEIARGELTHILPDYHLNEADIYAIHPFNSAIPPRVKAFLEFIQFKMKTAYNVGE
ncbi:LysR family transcriptional regulator [Shewanella sp. D64]|uniref:LysR family transcriptional regulator n=1 Tax=unclassified Shewanella TaxID=196818 RepID=UPI0022BA35C4|nr:MULTISPECIES: LysR family transcriptional regulator [unclassified Shewanella]MEC4727549.1 LysR family transcriptional regulator [Shewanella sp. D64]MEC4739800.1 LysR family transcriptional regulator [Shewanella sp. E94]WBJ95811.1 LysR family transcriptional regulator [Shewanella sp. MTB7]